MVVPSDRKQPLTVEHFDGVLSLCYAAGRFDEEECYIGDLRREEAAQIAQALEALHPGVLDQAQGLECALCGGNSEVHVVGRGALLCPRCHPQGRGMAVTDGEDVEPLSSDELAAVRQTLAG